APELGTDPRFSTRQARIAHYESLNSELDRRFSRHALAHWVDRLGQNDVPYAPIHTIDEVTHDPQVEHMELIVPVMGAHGGTRSVRPPVQFGGSRSKSVRAAPLLNEHGSSIREALARGERWPNFGGEAL
ncbi:MAG TPA: CoA transferase, partial [Candidatus Binataceae bacterium]|nr:CoA transferase [Candidatus Binataceae bacterium]